MDCVSIVQFLLLGILGLKSVSAACGYKNDKHHRYQDMTELLVCFNNTFSDQAYLYSIGQSGQSRELWVLAISGSDPSIKKSGRVEIKYVANMHGNEVVGKELLLRLAHDILVANPGEYTALMSASRIHLMPSMNPDGYELASTDPNDYLLGRANAANVDLNRNFPNLDELVCMEQNPNTALNAPDFYPSDNLQPETQAVITWLQNNNFALSANLHGGDLVANYPFDSSCNYDMTTGQFAQDYNKSPDDTLFQFLASSYATSHRNMSEPQSACDPESDFPAFHKGTTNGARWYSVPGGMQDFNYLMNQCFEITVELGCVKFPDANDLPDYWEANKKALKRYLQNVFCAVNGTVTSSEADYGVRVSGTPVFVNEPGISITTDNFGEYWRILPPGLHEIYVTDADGNQDMRQVIIPEGCHRNNHVAATIDFSFSGNESTNRFSSGRYAYNPRNFYDDAPRPIDVY